MRAIAIIGLLALTLAACKQRTPEPEKVWAAGRIDRYEYHEMPVFDDQMTIYFQSGNFYSLKKSSFDDEMKLGLSRGDSIKIVGYFPRRIVIVERKEAE